MHEHLGTEFMTRQTSEKKKKQLLFGANRYWPCRGGIEEGMFRLAGLLHESYGISVSALEKTSALPSLFRTTAGIRAFAPYADSNGIRVNPIVPSFWGRIIMLPILLRHFPGMRRFAPCASFDALYPAFGSALGPVLSSRVAHCSAAISFSGGYLGILMQRLARQMQKPVVTVPSVHPGQWGDSPLSLRSYANSDKVVVYTKRGKRDLEELEVNPKRIEVIPMPVDETHTGNRDRFRAKHSIDGPAVLYIGRRDAYKGLDLLVHSSEIAFGRVPNAKLVIAGPGPALREQPWLLDLKEINEQERADAYAGCDVVCVPSTSETLGLTYLESWFHAKPVVACRIPVTEELIEPGRDGELVDPNTGSLSSVLMALLNNPDWATEMGCGGKQKYNESFSSRVVRELWQNLLGELIR